MKAKENVLNRNVFIFLSIIIILYSIIWAGVSHAADTPAQITVKIRDIEKLVSLIDEFSISGGIAQGVSPSAMLRMMLQGTHWIDPIRSIVLSLSLQNETFSGTLLIPFLDKNEGFQASTQATLRESYYLIGIPPKQGHSPSSAFEKELFKESLSAAPDVISIKVRVSNLASEGRKKIPEWMEKMNSLPNEPSPAMPIGKEEVRAFFGNLLGTLEQMDHLGMTIDIAGRDLRMNLSVAGVPKTPLSEVLNSADDQSAMLSYAPEGKAFIFRCRGFNISKSAEILNNIYSPLANKLGFDLKLVDIMNFFTGASVFAGSFDGSRTIIESVYELKKGVNENQFLTETYIPWLKSYSQKAMDIHPQLAGSPLPDSPLSFSSSQVAGHHVIAMQYKSPEGFDEYTNQPIFKNESLKITAVNGFMVTVSDEQTLKRLIDETKGFRPKKDNGPFLRGKVSLSPYLEYTLSMIPNQQRPKNNIPVMGDLTFEADMKNGKASLLSSVNIDDLKRMSEFMQQVKPPPSSAAANQNAAGKKDSLIRNKTAPEEQNPVGKGSPSTGTVQPARKSAVTRDAKWYLDQGSLAATYGNYRSAISHYRKSIEMDPHSHMAFFNMGIAYGEIGEYEKSLSSINRAIELNNRNGAFYYGRARIHLLMNEAPSALEDLKTASILGNKDAIDYLSSQ